MSREREGELNIQQGEPTGQKLSLRIVFLSNLLFIVVFALTRHVVDTCWHLVALASSGCSVT